MLAYRQREIIFPERNKAVRFFLTIFVNTKIDLRSLAVDIPGDLAGWIKRFSIRQIIYQLGKVLCHLICILSRSLLIFQPAFPVLLYE